LPTTLLTVQEVEEAWQWLLTNISQRPDQPNHAVCTYDRKVFAGQPLNCQSKTAASNAGRLYLISQVGDVQAIMEMVNSGVYCSLVYWPRRLDRDVEVVVGATERFRNHLSEHLAFWARLATAAQFPGTGNFMCPKPNFQPEDKGPDGLFVLNGAVPQIEPQSVKNSISNPSSLIASAGFRSEGRLSAERQNYHPKQLEGFYLAHYENWGFGRMDRLLSHTVLLLGMSVSDEIRSALIDRCSYNAVVIADDQYANGDLFNGYQHVVSDRNRCFATYVGADNWQSFAEEVRRFVLDLLLNAGVL